MDIGVPSDFNEQQTDLYCRMVRHMAQNKAMFCHPDAAPVSDEHWMTTVANAAYFAAHCLDEDGATLCIVDDESGQVLALETPAGTMLN